MLLRWSVHFSVAVVAQSATAVAVVVVAADLHFASVADSNFSHRMRSRFEL